MLKLIKHLIKTKIKYEYIKYQCNINPKNCYNVKKNWGKHDKERNKRD